MRLVKEGTDRSCLWLWWCWRRILLVLVCSTAAATACECRLARSEGRSGEQLMIQGSNSGHLELWYRPEYPSSTITTTIMVVLHFHLVTGPDRKVTLNQTMWTPDTKDTTNLYRHISINYNESEDVTRVRGLVGKHQSSLSRGFRLVYALAETDQPVDWIICTCNNPSHQGAKYNTMLLAVLVLLIVAVVVVASWRIAHYYRRAKMAEHALALLRKNTRSCEEQQDSSHNDPSSDPTRDGGHTNLDADLDSD